MIKKFVAFVMLLSTLSLSVFADEPIPLKDYVNSEETSAWEITFNDNVPEAIRQTEEKVVKSLPREILDKMEEISDGLEVSVVDKMSKDADEREEYDLNPILKGVSVKFAHNTAYIILNDDTIIAHKLKNFNKEAEKRWDDLLKPQADKLFKRFRNSTYWPSEETSITEVVDNAKQFASSNALWIYFNCHALIKEAKQFLF